VTTEHQALVKNAGDKEQVRHARQKEKTMEELAIDDMKFMLSHSQGRRVLWRILEKCKTFESIWHGSALIHYQAGQQDLGHYLISEIASADEDMWLTMMKENRDRLAKET
jgi:hypothetical protein